MKNHFGVALLVSVLAVPHAYAQNEQQNLTKEQFAQHVLKRAELYEKSAKAWDVWSQCVHEQLKKIIETDDGLTPPEELADDSLTPCRDKYMKYQKITYEALNESRLTNPELDVSHTMNMTVQATSGEMFKLATDFVTDARTKTQ